MTNYNSEKEPLNNEHSENDKSENDSSGKRQPGNRTTMKREYLEKGRDNYEKETSGKMTNPKKQNETNIPKMIL